MAPVAPGYSRPVIAPIRLRTATALLALLALVALQPTRGASQASRDDGQWTMPGKDYAATRYTGLDASREGPDRSEPRRVRRRDVGQAGEPGGGVILAGHRPLPVIARSLRGPTGGLERHEREERGGRAQADRGNHGTGIPGCN